MEKVEKWSGCNYWVNTGKHSQEPLGTATSMHDCRACEYDGACSLQKESATWPYDADHDKRATEVTNEFRRQEKATRDEVETRTVPAPQKDERP